MRLEELKRVGVADVWKEGIPAARLTRDERGGVTFEYRSEYEGPNVAHTLPRNVTSTRTESGAIPAFFAGLLPEGRRLSAVRRATKTSADDELTLLLAVGRDTIGDVVVVPEGQDLQEAPEERAVRLEDCDFGEIFERVVGLDPVDRVGLPGVQDKISGRMLSLPLDYAGAAWILKLDPPEYPHLVENEAFFSEAARLSGIDTAKTEIVTDKRGRRGLLLRRFDRETRDGVPVSRAQEDACQVLERYPADKYRMSGEQVVRGLSENTAAPVLAARTFVQQFAFAFLTCNGDAHAKNFSIRHDGHEWRPCPAYDLPSTYPYGDTTMALTIQGRDREDIGHADFLAFGEACGLRTKATARVLDELLSHMPKWLGRLDELPYDKRVIHKLRKACEYRAERLRSRGE